MLTARLITRIAQLASFGLTKDEVREECLDVPQGLFDWAYKAAQYKHSARSKVRLSSCAGLVRASVTIIHHKGEKRPTIITYETPKTIGGRRRFRNRG